MGKYITEFFEMLKIIFGKQTSEKTQVIYQVKGRARTHAHTHTHTFNALCTFHCSNIRYV